MMKSTGTTYAHYKLKCQLPDACMDFESMWDAGVCYEKGGRFVKKCGEGKLVGDDVKMRGDAQEIRSARD
jgi:hypothetical protein